VSAIGHKPPVELQRPKGRSRLVCGRSVIVSHRHYECRGNDRWIRLLKVSDKIDVQKSRHPRVHAVLLNRIFSELFKIKRPAGELHNRDLEPLKLHLGCGRKILPDWVNIDIKHHEGVDVIADLDACANTPLPFPDDSVIEIQANHLIEHIAQALPFMQELHRVARAGAKAVFRCPYGSSNDAFEDPTHKRVYFPGSFAYFGQPAYAHADYGYRGDWDVVTATLILDGARFNGKTQEEVWNEVKFLNNVVIELVVELRAVKPIRPQSLELLRPVPVDFSFI
jgi:hypothetical protein